MKKVHETKCKWIVGCIFFIVKIVILVLVFLLFTCWNGQS